MDEEEDFDEVIAPAAASAYQLPAFLARTVSIDPQKRLGGKTRERATALRIGPKRRAQNCGDRSRRPALTGGGQRRRPRCQRRRSRCRKRRQRSHRRRRSPSRARRAARERVLERFLSLPARFRESSVGARRRLRGKRDHVLGSRENQKIGRRSGALERRKKSQGGSFGIAQVGFRRRDARLRDRRLDL